MPFDIHFEPQGGRFSIDARRWLEDVGTRSRNNMIRAMRTTPKTGRRYRRGRKEHIASSPGNAPAIDNGKLWQSITHEVSFLPVRRARFVMLMTVAANYAGYLEKGTSRMAARPFIAKAIEKAIAETPFPRGTLEYA